MNPLAAGEWDQLESLVRRALGCTWDADGGAGARDGCPFAGMCPVSTCMMTDWIRARSGAGAGASREWATLVGTLDVLPQPHLLCDPDGSVRHVNRSARERFGADPDRNELFRAARALCADASPRAEATVRLSGVEYHLRAAPVHPAGGGAAAVLLTVEAAAEHPAPEEALRRFDLTPAQLRVALLLLQRKSSRRIAGELHLSVHTVRHHAEQVLAKLGVRSRQEIAAAIGRAA